LNCYSSEEIATDGHEARHQTTPPNLWGDDIVRTDSEKRTAEKECLNADGSGGFRGVAVEDAFLMLLILQDHLKLIVRSEKLD
jgi:hypothetical protein